MAFELPSLIRAEVDLVRRLSWEIEEERVTVCSSQGETEQLSFSNDFDSMERR